LVSNFGFKYRAFELSFTAPSLGCFCKGGAFIFLSSLCIHRTSSGAMGKELQGKQCLLFTVD